MNRTITALIGAGVLALSGTAHSTESEDAESARELAKALQEHMVATYSCQKYLGIASRVIMLQLAAGHCSVLAPYCRT